MEKNFVQSSQLIDRNRDKPITSFYRNQSRLPKPRDVGTVTLNDHVDIFGYSATWERCAILEIKREGERFAGHQAILLAFAAFLVADRRAELGLPPNLTVDLGFVRRRKRRLLIVTPSGGQRRMPLLYVMVECMRGAICH